MLKVYSTIKHLLGSFLLVLLLGNIGWGQTITVPGLGLEAFGRGSTIAVPFTLNDAGSCVNKNTQFQLYLSDAAGNFAAKTLLNVYNGFYTPFINGAIPAGIPDGTNYRVMISSTNPAVSGISPPFTISGDVAVTASLTSDAPIKPGSEIIGFCGGNPNSPDIALTNQSSGTSTMATVTNELTGVVVKTINFTTPNQVFNPAAAHYTILVKSTDAGGTVGTYAYLLINNNPIVSLTLIGNNNACVDVGGSTIFFAIDPSSIKDNYPGSLYNISWGDGTPGGQYTYCEIKAFNGQIPHTYTKSSCSQEGNSFVVSASLSNAICGQVGGSITSSIKISVKGKNEVLSATGKFEGCVGKEMTFVNNSKLGEDASNGCITDQRYNWFFDGVLVYTNVQRDFQATHTFNTAGTHTVRLTSAGSSGCPATPADVNVCVQDPPTVDFTFNGGLQTIEGCATFNFTPVNISQAGPCTSVPAYSWVLTGPGNAQFRNGTTATSFQPDFSLTVAGVYKLKLRLVTPCGITETAEKTIVVNKGAVADLSPNVTLCGKDKLRPFDNTVGSKTRAILTGTEEQKPDTYTWTVTGGPFHYASGTGANSKYPVIVFEDYLSYTVKVEHKNNCGGIVSDIQVVTIREAPNVDAGTYPDAICPGQAIQLTGSITGGAYSSFQWIGQGTFTQANTLTPTYTPSAAEIANGSGTVTLRVFTAVTDCNQIEEVSTILIKPLTTVISDNTKAICTGNSVDYTPVFSIAGSTFIKSIASKSANAQVTNGIATDKIDDVVANTDPTQPATVQYTITPVVNGCNGTPFTFTVTINPRPAGQSQTKTLCNNLPAGITLSTNLPGTSYTWTASSTTLNVSGYNAQSTPTTNSQITDVLVNTSNTEQDVTYTVTPISSTGCEGTPFTILIKVQPSIFGNTLSGIAPVCEGSVPARLDGTVPQGSVGPYLYKWQNSTDGTVWNDIAGATAQNYQPPALSVTTQYRRIVTTACSPEESISAAMTITVIPTVTITNTGPIQICTGTSVNYTPQFSIAGSTFIRSVSSLPPNAQITYTSETDKIGDIITNTDPTQPVTVTYLVTPVNNGCNGTPFTLSVTITSRPVAQAAGTLICSNQPAGIQLTSNLPNTSYTWTAVGSSASISGFKSQPAATLTTAINDVLVNTGTSDETVTYTVTPVSGCDGAPFTVTVTVKPAIYDNTITPVAEVCNGDVPALINGSLPHGSQGNYQFKWQSNTDPANSSGWTDIAGATGQNYQPPALTVTTSYRRLVSSQCQVSADSSPSITISVNPRAVAEFTFDRDAGCRPFRIDAQNITAVSYPQNSVYNWFIGNSTTSIGSGLKLPSTGIVLNNEGESVIIRLVVTTAKGCVSAEFAHTFTATTEATPAFTTASPLESCGPMTVTFNNTSSSQTGVSFIWDFGGGIPSSRNDIANPGPVTFAENTDGTDAFYTVKLQSSSAGCGFKESAPIIIRIKPSKPIALISMDVVGGCAPFIPRVRNTSLGTNLRYVYSIRNSQGQLIEQRTLTTKDDQQISFNAINTIGTYTISMVAENDDCPGRNSTNTNTYRFSVSSANIVSSISLPDGSRSVTVCANVPVTFRNGSVGAQSFIYDFGDGKTLQVLNTNDVTYSFAQAGTYSVVLRSFNNCAPDGVASQPVNVTVLPLPTSTVTASSNVGCRELTVNFNATVGPTIVSVEWDFGDGSPVSDEVAPQHTFRFEKSPYTIKLKLTNEAGCVNQMVLTDYITVNAPSLTDFIVLPDTVISIPNYHFEFRDHSTGQPTTWFWDFGDLTTATSQNANHTYADTGVYKVTLRTANAAGCDSTLTRYVHITGIPGQLFVPNGFIPGSATTELRTFKAIGSGIQQYRLEIFNKWGELIWFTTKLDDNGRPTEGWDGTFKGALLPEGVYVWKMTARFKNGTQWKGMVYRDTTPTRTGPIHLIR